MFGKLVIVYLYKSDIFRGFFTCKNIRNKTIVLP